MPLNDVRPALVLLLVPVLLAVGLAGCLSVGPRERFEAPPVPSDAVTEWKVSQPLDGSATTLFERPFFHDLYAGANPFTGFLRVTSFARREGTDFVFAELYVETSDGHRWPLAVAGLLASDDHVAFRIGRDGQPVLGPIPVTKGDNPQDALGGMEMKGSFDGMTPDGTRLVLAVAHAVGTGPDKPLLELEFKMRDRAIGENVTTKKTLDSAGVRLLTRDPGFEGSSVTATGPVPVTRLEGVSTSIETANDTLLFMGAAVLREQNSATSAGNLNLRYTDSISSTDVTLGGNTNRTAYSLITLEPGASKWTFNLDGEGVLDFIVAWAEIPAAVPILQTAYV